MRSALLTSISHDLKTPLAAVLGSASTLRDLGGKLGDGEKAELLATVIDESERLNRFIANLLDMTKLESGAVTPNIAPHDLHEIVGSALRRAGKILSRHHVDLQLAADLPMVEVDAVLFEQAIFNILDNAAKYAPRAPLSASRAGSSTTRSASRCSTRATAFRRSSSSTSSTSSIARRRAIRCAPAPASGFAISRGFVEAMHGTIRAANRTDRSGAVFTINLPVPVNRSQRLEAAA